MAKDEDKAIENNNEIRQQFNEADAAAGYRVDNSIMTILVHPNDPTAADKLNNALTEVASNINITQINFINKPEDYKTESNILIAQIKGWALGRTESFHQALAAGYRVDGSIMSILAAPNDPSAANKIAHAFYELNDNVNINNIAYQFPPGSYDYSSQVMLRGMQALADSHAQAQLYYAALNQEMKENKGDMSEQEKGIETGELDKEKNDKVKVEEAEVKEDESDKKEVEGKPGEEEVEAPGKNIKRGWDQELENKANEIDKPDKIKTELMDSRTNNFEATLKGLDNSKAAMFGDIIKDINSNPLKYAEGGISGIKFINKLNLVNPTFDNIKDFHQSLETADIKKIGLSFNDDDKKSAFLNNFNITNKSPIDSITLSGKSINTKDIESLAGKLMQEGDKSKTISLKDMDKQQVDKTALVDLINKNPKLNIKADGILGMQLRFATAKRNIKNFFDKLTGKKEVPALAQKQGEFSASANGNKNGGNKPAESANTQTQNFRNTKPAEPLHNKNSGKSVELSSVTNTHSTPRQS